MRNKTFLLPKKKQPQNLAAQKTMENENFWKRISIGHGQREVRHWKQGCT